jgi:hypothetical protein
VVSRDDRRDMAHLGLILAIYGFALAPLLHAIYAHGGVGALSPSARAWVSHDAASHEAAAPFAPHDESAPHSHSPTGGDEPSKPPSHHHPGGASVEHSQAVALVTPLLLRPTVIWVQVKQAALGSERPRPGKPVRPTAMPQGP